MIDPELLKILICPSCQGSLEEVREALICRDCGLTYPVRDGIPVLLVDEALRHKDEERKK